jgi:hypothetical protein
MTNDEFDPPVYGGVTILGTARVKKRAFYMPAYFDREAWDPYSRLPGVALAEASVEERTFYFGTDGRNVMLVANKRDPRVETQTTGWGWLHDYEHMHWRIRDMDGVMLRYFPGIPSRFECDECDVDGPRYQGVVVDGIIYCRSCTARCPSCNNGYGAFHIRDEMTEWQNDHYCSDHVRECAECCTDVPEAYVRWVGGDMYCEDCSSYCDECGSYYLGDGVCCETGDIEPYGHTHANMWLGGPTNRDDPSTLIAGAYLGIENEISSSRMCGTPVKEWAQDNLQSRDALSCKEDSSVDGFEIVTQPMTPEFFESVNWESFFDMLNSEYPVNGDREPHEHGMHVHIGKQAFRYGRGEKVDDVSMAMFAYLLTCDESSHLERIARREPTSYCNKVVKPVSTVLLHAARQGNLRNKQKQRIINNPNGAYLGRNAISLDQSQTIEVRAFRATRSANELRDAVRLVYCAAEYVRHLRTRGQGASGGLNWESFSAWVYEKFPYAYESIAGTNKAPGTKAVTTMVNYQEAEGLGAPSSGLREYLREQERLERDRRSDASFRAEQSVRRGSVTTTGPTLTWSPAGYTQGVEYTVDDTAYSSNCSCSACREAREEERRRRDQVEQMERLQDSLSRAGERMQGTFRDLAQATRPLEPWEQVLMEEDDEPMSARDDGTLPF